MTGKTTFYVTTEYDAAGMTVRTIKPHEGAVVASFMSDLIGPIAGGISGALISYGLGGNPAFGIGLGIAGGLALQYGLPLFVKSEPISEQDLSGTGLKEDAVWSRAYRNALILLNHTEKVWYGSETVVCTNASKPWSFRAYRSSGVFLDTDGIYAGKQQKAWEEAMRMMIDAGLVKSADDTKLAMPFSRSRSLLKRHMHEHAFLFMNDKVGGRWLKKVGGVSK